jgi:threonine/homoserine/homoserine lactone efflux protein
VAIGCVYFRKPGQPLKRQKEEAGAHSDFTSALVLTLTNPTTVLSFLAVLTALGMGGHRPWWLTFLLVGGIFSGSMLWWVILVTLVNWLRDRFDEHSMRRMNRVAGLAIGAFGLFTFILGLTDRH